MEEMSCQFTYKNRKTKISSFNLKTGLFFIKQNFFLLMLIGCVGFVGMVALYKLFVVKPTYIYAKVKVGQGMWWASTQKPSYWFIKAIQDAKEQKDITGTSVATILDVIYYPFTYTQAQTGGQYDVYVTAKLKVSTLGTGKTYNFNRSTIGVSSPIDLEFPNVQFSGTIIALSTVPFKEKYVERTIYLTKRIPFPGEYEQIQEGDTQMMGERSIFTVLHKFLSDQSEVTFIQQGTVVGASISSFTIKGRIRLKEENGQYLYGEEYPVAPGKILQGVTVNRLTLSDYYITKIE